MGPDQGFARLGFRPGLGAGALGARGALDLVEQIGHGDHAGQSAEFTRGLGDRPGFMSGD